MIDVTGKLPQAQEMLQKVTAAQSKRGAKRSEVKLKGCPDPVIQFDLPELEEEKEAGKSTLAGQRQVGGREESGGCRGESRDRRRAPQEAAAHQAFYCLTGNLLAVTDNFEIIKGILGRAMGQQKDDSLASHKPFQIVMQRCKVDYRDAPPQARWYIHPVGYAEAARASTPESQRRKGKTHPGSDEAPGRRRRAWGGRIRRLLRRRIRVGPSHGRVCPAALREGDEDAGVAQRRGLHAAAVGAARHRHLLHAVLRHPATPSTTSGRCSTNCSPRATRARGNAMCWRA